jgi:hypothetical protein
MAWGLSQYLPTDGLPADSMRSAETATANPSAAPTHSVALFDFAVTVLPASSGSEQPVGDAYLPESAAAPAAPLAAAVAIKVPEPALLANDEATLDPDTESALAEKIQRELRRVGCLKSAVDGRWGADSRRAMRRFAKRIEADLSVDRPASVLLMLVEHFEGRACGRKCPSGEVLGAQDRCVPETVLADSQETGTAGLEMAGLSTPPVENAAGTPQVDPLASEVAAGQPIKTSISRVVTKRRLARLVTTSQRTRWSLPRYSLGFANAPRRVVKPARKSRYGRAAAYRRWMKRANISMR